MWDGSAVPVEENLSIAEELLGLTAKARIILEIEVGVVGGEEDGVSHEINDKLYTTVEDGLRTIEVLGAGDKGRYITALTFGNVHGVYKPGAVKLRPEVLKEIQQKVGEKIGVQDPFDLVFHGGSGSTLE
ncbi:class II fructose-bisphosphate aldolase, partial [Xanthomonas citri pv. citri]